MTALGAGVDIVNIRLVCFVNLPHSFVAFAQGSGRGGRDGRTCITVVVFGSDELYKSPENNFFELDIESLRSFLATDSCRRACLSEYFDGKRERCDPDHDELCDNCTKRLKGKRKQTLDQQVSVRRSHTSVPQDYTLIQHEQEAEVLTRAEAVAPAVPQAVALRTPAPFPWQKVNEVIEISDATQDIPAATATPRATRRRARRIIESSSSESEGDLPNFEQNGEPICDSPVPVASRSSTWTTRTTKSSGISKLRGGTLSVSSPRNRRVDPLTRKITYSRRISPKRAHTTIAATTAATTIATTKVKPESGAPRNSNTADSITVAITSGRSRIGPWDKFQSKQKNEDWWIKAVAELEAMKGQCTFCWVTTRSRIALDHNIENCTQRVPLEDFGPYKPTYSEYRSWRKALQFSEYTCCYQCALPMNLCNPVRVVKCLYGRNIVAPVAYMAQYLPTFRAEVEALMGKPLHSSEYLIWLGQKTELYGKKCSNLMKVFEVGLNLEPINQ
ncbi:uncharacterized protein LAJ45_11573 [Morchella importuna]|uniref:uncharacterized protein n=1 Tax=Morchella importuna TaxID=1174673 RepID=UPI001E8EE46E|nr:uncharacterized protein LAJ45_11573 [Morchella importuna]KAH8144443.1 hypothetical protein LAJ45_11573 [Morchella importuna]